MQQIVNTLPVVTNFVELKDYKMQKQDCFGIQFGSNTKAFITADTFCENYSVRDTKSFTHANHFAFGTHKTLEACLTRVLETPQVKVFKFTSPQKLFKWLSEE